jgi:hypothetical protein
VTDLTFSMPAELGSELGAPTRLSIRAGNVALTRLRRATDADESDYLEVPAASLAFWLLDHWWRLRWESIPPGGINPTWRIAHELASIGGGFAWPRITIWGEGPRVGLISRSDPQGVMGPVRFLTDALVFVEATTFETAIDRFVEMAGEQASAAERDALTQIMAAVQSERADPEIAAWRRLEAMAGFDPDAAPSSLMDALGLMEADYPSSDVEEVVSAAPGAEAAATFRRIIDETPASAYADVAFDPAVRIGVRELGDRTSEPWQLAENAAAMIRNDAGVGSKPLRNRWLGELTGVMDKVFRTREPAGNHDLPYGLRLAHSSGGQAQVLLRSKWSRDRRFELARGLGDAIWTSSSPLGPTSRSGNTRQKFQRAFAASLLCPADALVGFLGTDRPSDTDISAAASHFHVSERAVRSVLVNKHVLARHRLALPVSDLRDDRPIEELAEAA